MAFTQRGDLVAFGSNTEALTYGLHPGVAPPTVTGFGNGREQKRVSVTENIHRTHRDGGHLWSETYIHHLIRRGRLVTVGTL